MGLNLPSQNSARASIYSQLYEDICVSLEFSNGVPSPSEEMLCNSNYLEWPLVYWCDGSQDKAINGKQKFEDLNGQTVTSSSNP
ncbi:unnamed protein product [Dovyalis caffra]|uniref:Uncharacterized protein n=1 Tax=Dovyalis caffra TaxID=77055 RepID=A0AAV1R5J6_9ROSI|nr:unnamed protein product [Dovyalis caffra]